MRRRISNLLSNAIRHAEPGSQIRVLINQSSEEASISVENAGETIAQEALPRLFDRFFRVEASRHGSGDSNGLGLAIVAAIARMQGGSTHATSSRGITSIGFTLSRTSARTSDRARLATGRDAAWRLATTSPTDGRGQGT